MNKLETATQRIAELESELAAMRATGVPVGYYYKFRNAFGCEVWSTNVPRNGQSVLEVRPLYTHPKPAAQAGEKTGHCHKRANDFCRCSRKAMLCDGVGPPPQPAAQDAEWVPVTERLPEPGIPVLLDIGARFPIRALWAAKGTVKALDDDSDWAEYDEETGSSWCPEGWYEWNQHEEVHWAVNAAPVAWCELPPLASEAKGAI